MKWDLQVPSGKFQRLRRKYVVAWDQTRSEVFADPKQESVAIDVPDGTDFVVIRKSASEEFRQVFLFKNGGYVSAGPCSLNAFAEPQSAPVIETNKPSESVPVDETQPQRNGRRNRKSAATEAPAEQQDQE